ncbi:50S ribosomal subunit protein L15 [Ascosphaera apis ARSEF 7405]|uniref:50S ribosomal subunit protein L15 n=1 Tax=Ascosphaera apis ARSEF 7405 TaxID=392613 RepID=A0A162I005_9EURO|nr:50S ribosomal subunit protein L15 [Ascosphaera apis ARSEF 7405]
MPPRLNLRLPSQVSSLIHHHQFPAPATQSSLIPAFQRLWAQPLAQASQTRDASLLSRLSDAPGAKHRAIRRGRGPASGKGKTSGRGHKGQKQHGKVPAGFQGGQTPIEVVKGKRGFENIFAPDMATVNLDRLQSWIDMGRIDPSKPITVRELFHSRCIHSVKDGVKLLASGGREALKQPVQIVVSRASQQAIEAVEAAGGTIVTRYYTDTAIRRIIQFKTPPFASLAWEDEKYKIGMGMDAPLKKGEGYQYRLPDPVKRTDIEYYRDPAHRGYLSHLVAKGETPSLFFLAPEAAKHGGKDKSEKKLGENRVW